MALDSSSRKSSIDESVINQNNPFIDQTHTSANTSLQTASSESDLQPSSDRLSKPTKRDSEGRHLRCERCIKNKKKCDGNQPKCGTCGVRTPCIWPEANFTRQELLRHNKRAKKDKETMSEEDNAATSAAKQNVIMSGTEDAARVGPASDVVDAPSDNDARLEAADSHASTDPNIQADTREVVFGGTRLTVPILPRIDISQNAPGDYQPLVDYMINLDLEDANLITNSPGVEDIIYLQYLFSNDPHPMGQVYQSEDDDNNTIYKVVLMYKEYRIDSEEIPMYIAIKAQYDDLRTDILRAQIAADEEAARAQREDPELARQAQEYYSELLRRAPGGPDYEDPASASASASVAPVVSPASAADPKASSSSPSHGGEIKEEEKEEEKKKSGEGAEKEEGTGGWRQKSLQEVLEGDEEEWMREVEEANRRGIMLPY